MASNKESASAVGTNRTSSERQQQSANCFKTVYLIRHGQSKGQVAKREGVDRKRDLSLIDCGLTQKGIQQAGQIVSFLEEDDNDDEEARPGPSAVELVVSSPLTRALETAIHGFQYQEPRPPILLHYGLREVGSSLPENRPRDIRHVLSYIQKHSKVSLKDMNIDAESLRPSGWPNIEEHKNESSERMERIQDIFKWLVMERPEQCIAVVCHDLVIRAALASSKTGSSIRPRNGHPIRCHLFPDGNLKHCKEL